MNHDSFKGASWYNKLRKLQVIVVGAGGTGSWLTLLLTRAGVTNIGVYDDDLIESRNNGGQFFKLNQVGNLKVKALAENIKEFTGVEIYQMAEKFTDTSMVAPVMCSMVDNMHTRKLMFDKWCNYEDKLLFVDVRLDFEQSDVFIVDESSIDQYRETLFDDSELAEPQCTMRQTTHIAFHVHTAIEGIINFLEGRPYKFRTTNVTPMSYVETT